MRDPKLLTISHNLSMEAEWTGSQLNKETLDP